MNRRTFLDLTGAAAAGTVFPPGLSCGMRPYEAVRSARPNVVVIVADDLGWGDVGYHGSQIETPAIDRMVRDGAELDRFMVYPIGTPTRASLMTGRVAGRIGITGQLKIADPPPLPGGQETIASLLRRAGYDTAFTGKWNLGNELSSAPDRYGFNHSHGFLGPWIDSYTHRTAGGRATWFRNGAFIGQQGHATDLVAEEAIRFIGDENLRDPAKPFYLQVAFNAPHLPLQEDGNRLRRYRDMFVNESRRYYAAMVTHLDEAVGDILHELRRNGLADNTLVIFFSDNGAEPPGAKSDIVPAPTRNTTGDTGLYGVNTPLSGWKYTLYEGGIRVPAIMYWPGRIAPGRVVEPVAVFDILPTVLALAGIRKRPETILDGIDIWPSVTGERALPDRVLYFRIDSAMSLSAAGWKLMHIGGTLDRGHDELYCIEQDTAEIFDLAAIDPDIYNAFRAELERQYARDPVIT